MLFPTTPQTLTSLHLCCGAGGDMLGFAEAGFDVRGVDNDKLACDAARYLTGAPVLCADLLTTTPRELAAFTDCPDVVVLSAPCQGNSKCLPAKMSKTAKYQDLNRLAEVIIELVAKTSRQVWGKNPAVIFFENVSGIKARSNHVLDNVRATLRVHGYVFDERYHDCGSIGGLAQHRERYLLIARDPKHCPAYILHPPAQRVRGIAEVLGSLPTPIPRSGNGGAMHELPRVSDLNALRLALIRAGYDWRDLPPSVKIGASATKHGGHYGVMDDEQPSNTVLATARMDTGRASTRDRRLSDAVDPRAELCPQIEDRPGRHAGYFGVQAPNDPAHAVIGSVKGINANGAAVDPRVELGGDTHKGTFGVEDDQAAAHAVIGEKRGTRNWGAATDPRITNHPRSGTMQVNPSEEPSTTIIGHARAEKGNTAADPRLKLGRHAHNGPLGVEHPAQPAHAIIGEGRSGNTWASLADPRTADPRLPQRAGRQNGQLGVEDSDHESHAVIARNAPSVYWSATNDARLGPAAAVELPPVTDRQNGALGVLAPDQPSRTIRARVQGANQAAHAADPRTQAVPHTTDPRTQAVPHTADIRLPRAQPRSGGYGVQDMAQASGAVIASADVTAGAFATQDQRVHRERTTEADPNGVQGFLRFPDDSAQTAPKSRKGKSRKQTTPPPPSSKGWRMDGALFAPTHRITATDEGLCVVTLPGGRELDLARTQTPRRTEQHVVIVALDGTYHRPLTTLELAALQSFPVLHKGAWLCFPGTQAQQRKLIGNAIPPAAAYAVATEVAAALRAPGLAGVLVGADRHIWTTPHQIWDHPHRLFGLYTLESAHQ
jgi:site-specific DNA-cytosine methylase